jgi:hypothetical protein
MHQHIRYIYGSLLKLFLAAALLFVGIGCDSLLPEKFKEKDFNAADIDARASDWLTRDTLNDPQGVTVAYEYASVARDTFRVVPVCWTTINSRSLASFADSATRANSTDNQIISSTFDVLVDSLEPLLLDTMILVHYPDNLPGYPADQRATYALLRVDQAKDICLYTSLFFYWDDQTNLTDVNEYVTIDIVKRDTSLVSVSSALSPEGTSTSIQTILVNQALQYVRTINGRFKAHLDIGDYLVRFKLSNPTSINNPQLQPRRQAVFLPPPSGEPVTSAQPIGYKFKVIILSF